MSDEMKVQTKGLNKTFLFIAITLIAVGLIAALVVLIPISSKAKKVEEQLNLGAKYLSELNYEQAIVAYEAVIKIDPKCEEAYLALADVYIATGELDKAEEVLKKAEASLGSDVTDAVAEKRKEVEKVRKEQEKSESTPGPTLTVTPSPTPTNTPTPMLIMNWKDIFKYRVEADQTATIIEALNKKLEEVVIPSEVDGYQVKKIQSYAFAQCFELKRVEIPDSIVEIGNGAFQNCGLEYLVIPSSVVKIEGNMTPLCHSLKEIIVDKDNDYYVSKEGVLFDKNMECLICMPGGYETNEYSIPSGVTKVGIDAFNGCWDIEWIAIPESVSSIEERAFWNCHNLKEITISKNVSNIGAAIVLEDVKINVDVDNDYFFVEDGVLFSKDKSRLLICGKKGESYKVPDEVERIDSYAFFGSCIEEIELSENLKSIDSQGFHSCKELRAIVVPGEVDTIGVQMFAYCGSLERVEILEGVTEIANWAFQDCNNLQEVAIPESVLQIGDAAFENCDNVVIYTSSGSYAEQWAMANGIKVVAQ